MFTPDELVDYSRSSLDWSAAEGAALVSLGRSSWLNSFSLVHLSRCSHFRAVFYDEILDVLCESIDVADGPYASGS